MNARWIALLVVGALGLGLVAGHVMAGEHEEKGGGGMPPMAKPGPEHAELAKAVGNWSAEMKYWMAPGSEPMTSTDSTSSKMILGGWFLEEDYTGTSPMGAWTGKNLLGYDQNKKEYVNVWISSHGSDLLYSRGKKGEDGNIHLFGTGFNSMTKKDMDLEMVYTHIDADTAKFEMYILGEGKKRSYKMMEINYKRKK